jgi:hypothetical protein
VRLLPQPAVPHHENAASCAQSGLEVDQADSSGSRTVPYRDDFDDALKDIAPAVGDRSMREMEVFARDFDRPVFRYMKKGWIIGMNAIDSKTLSAR